MNRFSKLTLVAGAALALGLSACGKKEEQASTAAPAAEEKVLHIYNWSDYIAPDTVANFEKETGIKVTYDVFDSNEVLQSKLLAGHTGYDVVVPSGAFLERQLKAGVFQPLDKSKLTNYGNLDPAIMKRLEGHDPGNKYAVPWLWGTTGIGYNEDMILKRDPKAPVDSLDIVFKPEEVKKFKDCGVTMLDAPSEIMEMALNYLGFNPHTESKEEMAKAEDLLMKIRPYVKYFHSSKYIDDLANGEICLVIGWSGDVGIAATRAADRAKAANTKPLSIKYSIPKEGTINWFDLMAIPADAPHPNNAHLWINYILRPEVEGPIVNSVTYPSGNAAAKKFIDPALLNDPNVYPPQAVLDKLWVDRAPSMEVDRERTRIWTKVTTGQ